MISARNWRAAWQRTYPKKSAALSESCPDGASCATQELWLHCRCSEALPGFLAQKGAGAQTYKRNSDHPFFAAHPKYHFVMDNHVTTNSFFTATIYGCQDFCALTGCTFTWTGSQTSVVGQMVVAMESAIASKAAGIGVPLIDNTAFNAPTNAALNAGIPVIAYNADVAPGFVNNRQAYVGQSNLTAGAAVASVAS